MEKDVWNFNVILANCARETGLLFILRNIAAMQMINFIKLKIASVPLSGKILTLTENTPFLPRKEGVKAFLFTLLKKNELFLLPLAATGKFLHLSSSVFRFRWSHVQHSLVREEVPRSGHWTLSWMMQLTSQSSCFKLSVSLGRYIYLVILQSWFQLICGLEIHVSRKKIKKSDKKIINFWCNYLTFKNSTKPKKQEILKFILS